LAALATLLARPVALLLLVLLTALPLPALLFPALATLTLLATLMLLVATLLLSALFTHGLAPFRGLSTRILPRLPRGRTNWRGRHRP